MNKRNSNDLPPRQFPKREYTKLTHKIGLVVILPLTILLIGGGIGVTCYHHQVHHTYQVAHKPVPKKSIHPKQVNRPITKINAKQGEHLLGYWLRKSNYSNAKAQTILFNYQKQNGKKEIKIGQKLNQLTHSNVNIQIKIKRIRHFINKEF